MKTEAVARANGPVSALAVEAALSELAAQPHDLDEPYLPAPDSQGLAVKPRQTVVENAVDNSAESIVHSMLAELKRSEGYMDSLLIDLQKTAEERHRVLQKEVEAARSVLHQRAQIAEEKFREYMQSAADVAKWVRDSQEFSERWTKLSKEVVDGVLGKSQP